MSLIPVRFIVNFINDNKIKNLHKNNKKSINIKNALQNDGITKYRFIDNVNVMV